jgi:hypothetical protein
MLDRATGNLLVQVARRSCNGTSPIVAICWLSTTWQNNLQPFDHKDVVSATLPRALAHPRRLCLATNLFQAIRHVESQPGT